MFAAFSAANMDWLAFANKQPATSSLPIRCLLLACAVCLFLAGGIFCAESPRELFYLLLRFLPGDTVALLDSANKLLFSAVNHLKIIIRQLAPFFFSLSRILLPFSLNLIPIHDVLLWLSNSKDARSPAL